MESTVSIGVVSVAFKKVSEWHGFKAMMQNFVRALIIFALCCIVYVLVYIIYILWKLVNYIMWWGKMDPITKPFWAIFDKIALITFGICLMFLPAVSIFFLILWFVWKVFGFFLRGVSPFSDCEEFGVFRFIERIFEISGARDAANEKAKQSAEEIVLFLKTFFEKTFGIIFEGYEINNDYLKTAIQYYVNEHLFPDDKARCNALKEELMKFLKNGAPLIRITYDDNKSQAAQPMPDIKNIDECIAAYTKPVPPDAGTVEKLKSIFWNEIAKKKCQFTFANTCPSRDDNSVDASCVIAEMERNIKNFTDDFGESTMASIGARTSAMSDNFAKQQASIDAQIKKD
jgi:hypothetical protein